MTEASGASPPRLAAAAASIQVGAAIVATRFVIGETDPASLALLRYVVGVLCLLPFLSAPLRVRFARRDLLPMAAARHRPVRRPDRAAELRAALRAVGARSLIFATFPMWTMIFAAMLGRERLTAPKTRRRLH